MAATEISIIVSYVLFLSVFLFFAPIMQDDILSVDNEDIQGVNTEVEAGIFEIVVGFINTLISRFSILIGVSTSNLFVGMVLTAWSIGAVVAVAKLIAEALP